MFVGVKWMNRALNRLALKLQGLFIKLTLPRCTSNDMRRVHWIAFHEQAPVDCVHRNDPCTRSCYVKTAKKIHNAKVHFCMPRGQLSLVKFL